MKQFALTILGFANMAVGCIAAMGIEESANVYYHGHWTAFHLVALPIIMVVTASTTMLCFVPTART